MELTDLIISLTGSKSNIVFNPLPDDDPKQKKPDIHQAEETLTGNQQFKLENGFKKMIGYFEEVLNV